MTTLLLPRPLQLTNLLNEALFDSSLPWNHVDGINICEEDRLAAVFRSFAREASRGSTRVRRTWRRPDGRTFTVMGRQLADLEVIEAARGRPLLGNHEKEQRGFMMLAVERNDGAAVRWGLRCGLNPCRFDHVLKLTPMGLAAIKGNDVLIEMMWSSGADVLMTLRPEHNPSTPDGLGTTLLHRMLRRIRNEDFREGIDGPRARTAAFLASVYPEPMPLDNSGRSPLEGAAPGPVAEAVRRVLAARANRRLTEELAHPTSEPTPRLRM